MLFAHPWWTLIGLTVTTVLLGLSFRELRRYVAHLRTELHPWHPLNTVSDTLRLVGNTTGILWAASYLALGMYLFAGSTQDFFPSPLGTPGLLLAFGSTFALYGVVMVWWIPKRELPPMTRRLHELSTAHHP
jgi:hypothetical protein